MIDFIKFEVLDKSLFKHNLETKSDIRLTSKFDIETGAIMDFPIKGNLKNFQISITENKAYVSGSIHKYSNLLRGLENQNYNDFSYKEFQSSIIQLCDSLLIKPEETKVTNLEFGFNLEVNEDPKYIIENKLLMYDFKDPNRNQKYSGKGNFKKFEMSDYSIKVYNKSKQYKIDNKNILRIELKISKTRYLQRLGIWNIGDLNEKIFKTLFDDFLKRFNKLIIIDTLSSCDRPRFDDESYLKIWTNPISWNEIRITEKLPERNKIKTRLFKLLHKYYLLNTKNELRELINNKFALMLNCNDYKLLHSNN